MASINANESKEKHCEQSQNEIKSKISKTKPIISPTLRINLIQSVVNERLSIYRASINHGINYSTAKHIVRQYKNDLPNFLQDQRKTKKVQARRSNVTIIVDTSNGDVTFYQENRNLCQQDTDLQRIDEQVFHSIGTSFLNFSKQFMTNKASSDIQIDNSEIQEQSQSRIQNLFNILKWQYSKMNE